MKLFRFGKKDDEKPGVLLPDGKRIDASAFGEDYDEAFFTNNGLAHLAEWVKNDGKSAPEIPADVRLASCICRPSKIICIGLNFKDHAAESGMEIPTEPVVFFKASTSLSGPNDPVMIPRNGEKVDWEVELAAIIGKRANYVDKKDALDYVAGYALHNDYSERKFQLEQGGQWVKGKSCDTFAPLGPYLATPDEIADLNNMKMWLKINGEMTQQGNTSYMIFDVATLVSYLSDRMTLLPGDVISTGTPPGVGLGFDPPRYLKAGDVVELGIEGLGASRQEIVPFRADR